MDISINYMAVGIAVLANFIIGWLWYGPLFGKPWATEMGMDINEKPEAGVMAKGMIFMVIGNFLMAYVLAHDIFVWSLVPGMEENSSMMTAVMTAFFTWLGFYVPTHLGATVWEKKSWKLTIINLSYHFVTLFVAAIIILSI
jgi:hypothetical protein